MQVESSSQGHADPLRVLTLRVGLLLVHALVLDFCFASGYIERLAARMAWRGNRGQLAALDNVSSTLALGYRGWRQAGATQQQAVLAATRSARRRATAAWLAVCAALVFVAIDVVVETSLLARGGGLPTCVREEGPDAFCVLLDAAIAFCAGVVRILRSDGPTIEASRFAFPTKIAS